jgi:Zn-dependent protease
MKFSANEKRDLRNAGLILSLAFAILLSGGYSSLFSPNALILIFPIAFITAGLGFLLHELMHKFVAQSYGLLAEFKAFYGMLWLALGLSLFGFILAAPGAVFIRGNMTREQNGKISLAGPLTNIVLSIIFLSILFLFSSNSIVFTISSFGLTINALLAAFNMIPVQPFDGSKIISWSKPVYYLTTIGAVGLFVLSFFI